LLQAAPDQASYAKSLGQACVAIKDASDEGCAAVINYARLHNTDAVAARLAASIILTRHDSSRFALARQLLQTAITIDPRSAEGYYEMGVLEQEQGKWQNSVAMLKKSDALRHASSKTHLRLAIAYSHLDLKEQAHEEAALQKQLRQSEDADIEAKRSAIRTFMLEMQ
jgi:lipopolysaccharide biosynthesis regulator YciM